MNLVYYAHSYRKEDAPVVEFFSEVMYGEGLIASLDPPSDRLNSAKPERHLRFTDGMVAVLTARKSGVSEYILYEISLCIRAGKPLLVFVEDTLSDTLVPPRVLQRRFSRRALLRQMRDHSHAIRSLRSYIGDEPPPAYQPSIDQRRCLVGGSEQLSPTMVEELTLHLRRRGYSPRILGGDALASLYDPGLQETVNNADLAVALIDSPQGSSSHFLGLLRASFVPSILLTTDENFPFNKRVPREYQPRFADVSCFESLWVAISYEVSIAEEEYVDLKNENQVKRYANLLFAQSSRVGGYTQDTRNSFIQEIHMNAENINLGQAGSMGTHSTGTLINYGAAWDQIKGKTDLNALSAELAALRSALRDKAETPEQDASVAAVSQARADAASGNGAGALSKLATAGKWALEVAKDIGVEIAAKAIQTSLGLSA